MKIDIILPYKEVFSEKSASAVSITVKNSMGSTKFLKQISVYGQYTNFPLYKNNFVGIKVNKIFNFGKNYSIIKNYLKKSNVKKSNNTLIELHNRPYLFHYLIKHVKHLPIALYYHNDPTEMKGSKTIDERKKILKKAAGVICVSQYIKKQFLKGIGNNNSKVYVLSNGIKRDLKVKPKKEKIVMFVGRLVYEKGPHIFVNSIDKLVKKHPDWKFVIIGTSKAGQKKLENTYEKELIKTFLGFGRQAKYLGFLPNTKVKKFMQTSSIIVVPSIWNEPFALTALEGLASGQAVVATNRGGLKEMLRTVGILINNINVGKLELALDKLMSDKKKLRKYQNMAWKNFKYDQKNISKKQDLMREQIYKNFFK